MKIVKLLAIVAIVSSVMVEASQRRGKGVADVLRLERSDTGAIAQREIDLCTNLGFGPKQEGVDDVCQAVFNGGLAVKNLGNPRAFADLCCNNQAANPKSKAYGYLGCGK